MAGDQVMFAGLVVRPHKPPTAKEVLFFSLEDETGFIHVTVMPDIYEKIGSAIYDGGMVTVTGSSEERGVGVSLLATHVATSS